MMAADSRTTTNPASKFITEPKAVYSLSIENLSHIAAYSPNDWTPDSLISKMSIQAGCLFSPITTATDAAEKRWSTVQVSKDKHMDLNSALVYMNHSCKPSIEIDVDMMEIRVSKARDLQPGDELTFFYPSTEWQMDKPFACLCGAGEECLGTVTGAADIDEPMLTKWFINEHILKMKKASSKGH